MALLFFDSCGDNVGAAGSLAGGPWVSTTNAAVVAGGQNGTGIQITPAAGAFGQLTVPNVSVLNNPVSGGSVGFGMGVAWNIPTLTTATVIPIFQVGRGATFWTLSLQFVSSVWSLYFNDNATGTVNIPFTPAAATWYYSEFFVSSLQSGNVVTLRINGTTLVQGTMPSSIPDSPLVNAYVGGPVYVSATTQPVIYDNFYCFSGTGGLVTSMLGPQVVSVLTPAGNGRVDQFTANGASPNYNCVNTIPPNPAKFVSSNAVGTTDCYTLSALPGGLGPINGVEVTVNTENTVSGRTLSIGLGNGTTENYSNTLAPGASYLMGSTAYDTNPFTSVGFVTGDFSTLQLAIQIHS